jgi:hypothetical protein
LRGRSDPVAAGAAPLLVACQPGAPAASRSAPPHSTHAHTDNTKRKHEHKPERAHSLPC